MLNEVAALSLPLQAKLLRAMEEQHTERVGGNHSVEIKATIIALTAWIWNRRGAACAAQGSLLSIECGADHHSPLRERKPDIDALAEHFLWPGTGYPQTATDEVHIWSDSKALQEYEYPGMFAS